MSREIAIARCPNCAEYRPVSKGFFYDLQIFCIQCGHISAIKQEEIRWMSEERWRLASRLFDTPASKIELYVTREITESSGARP